MPDPVTGITVGTSLWGHQQAGKQAAAAAAGADAAAEAQMYAADKEFEIAERGLKQQQKAFDFEKKKYKKWEKIYGPMQKNLAKQYSKLDPNHYAALGIKDFNKEYDKRMESVMDSLAQRGIDTQSGAGIAAELQGELGAAETVAGIRSDARDQVRAMKTDFLQIGLGQEPNMQQAHANLTKAYGDLSQTAGNYTTIAGNRVNTANSRFDTAMRSEAAAEQTLITEAGTALGDYWQSKIDERDAG